jgi:hypothetical protein
VYRDIQKNLGRAEPKGFYSRAVGLRNRVIFRRCVSFHVREIPYHETRTPSILWMAAFTAVLESKTHPTDEVNKAIDLLRAKYAD